jgi:DNA-binding transcriptional ArsR family regulator
MNSTQKADKKRIGFGGYKDPRVKRLFWHLLLGTRGGITRAKILDLVKTNPANAYQISNILKMNYKTVLHHIEVLTKNGLIITDNKGSYGSTYFLAPLIENHYEIFGEILTRIENG